LTVALTWSAFGTINASKNAGIWGKQRLPHCAMLDEYVGSSVLGSANPALACLREDKV
jgi:hypothetical protein